MVSQGLASGAGSRWQSQVAYGASQASSICPGLEQKWFAEVCCGFCWGEEGLRSLGMVQGYRRGVQENPFF